MHTVILMAKAPLPGLAKSRLVSSLGLDTGAAARLADAFVRDTLLACDAATSDGLVIAFAPSQGESYFRAVAPAARLVVQTDGDLGDRILAAFAATFAFGSTRAVMIAMDTPHLPADRITQAFSELDHADCVLGPATDGGYYLIALRQPQPDLFRGIDWSTERVLVQTLERARAAGLRTTCLAEMYDIDRPEDVRRLTAELAADNKLCRHTAQALRIAPPPAHARAAGSDDDPNAPGSRSPRGPA